MGQKTHPIGLRLGLHRKWATSWYTPTNTNHALNKPANERGANLNPVPIHAKVNSHGGQIRGGREERISSLLGRYPLAFPYTKGTHAGRSTQEASTGTGQRQRNKRRTGRQQKGGARKPTSNVAERLLPIDLSVRVGPQGHLSLVFLYAKLLGRD